MAKNYDLVIIGAGPGGYTAAKKAAQFGMKTAIVEEKKLGGTCVNRGCIPTKALLHASYMFHSMLECDRFGVYSDFVSFDFGKMQQYKRLAVESERISVEQTLSQLGVDVFYGRGVLRRGRTVEVKSGEAAGEFLEGKNIILATGAAPILPEIPGSELVNIWDSDRLLAAKTWNFDRLLIVGGGVIAVELATVFNNLCSKVTIVELKGHLMSSMDPVVSTKLEETLRHRGIDIYCGHTVRKISMEKNEPCAVLTPTSGNGEVKVYTGQILIAAGRKPFTENLEGPDVSLMYSGGKLMVSKDFESSEPGVYAIGDVCSKIQLAHVAAAQATYVVERLAGRVPTVRLEVVPAGMYVPLPIVPSCIYTDPEIATVGLTEEMARKNGLKVRCGHFSMRENGKSIISGQRSGFIRLVFEAYSNTIVGAQMMCPRATDMIGELATAIANSLTAEQMSYAMRAQPTYNEGIGAAIEDAMRT